MIKFKHLLGTLLAISLGFSQGAWSQNNTNSPYTRYGLGQLSEQSFSNSRAMGGVAYGLRNKSQINVMNPASYSAVDSLTFLFDGGFSLTNTNYSNGNVQLNAKNSSFDYIAMQFRLHKKLGLSLGFLPYSFVGYNLTTRQDIENSENKASVNYAGEGGYTQAFIGIGAEVFKNLSIGANLSYLYGSTNRSIVIGLPSTGSAYSQSVTENVSIKDYKLDLGLQYLYQLDKDRSLTLGLTYSLGHKLNNEATKSTVIESTSLKEEDISGTLEMPSSYGIGLAYNYKNKLTLGADYNLQTWSSSKYLGAKDYYSNYSRMSLGAEYVPNNLSRSYFSRVSYRLGAYYSKPNYKINGTQAYTEYGVTGGFGFPIARSKSILSISAKYSKVKSSSNQFVNQDCLSVSIGITFNERWFFKRKVN